MVRRILLVLLAAALFGTGFVGVLHTSLGRPLLLRLAGIAGCPLGKASAGDVEAARRRVLQRDRGSVAAPARPALGFTLDRTSVEAVRGWAASHGLHCDELRAATLLTCKDVPATALGRSAGRGHLADVAFGFSLAGSLVSVTTLYLQQDAASSTAIARELRSAVEDVLGPPQRTAGSFEGEGTSTLAYRFRDYSADLTTTHVAGRGFTVREQYLSTL